MVQSGPYSPRTLNGCVCHAPCIARIPPGKHLWVVAPDATGAFRFFREPFKLTESNAFLWCTWEATTFAPFGGGVIFLTANYRYFVANPPGTGVPLTVVVEVAAQVVFTPYDRLWQTFASQEVTEQFNCRQTLDLHPVPDGQDSSPWFSEPTGVNGPLLTKWGGGVSPF